MEEEEGMEVVDEWRVVVIEIIVGGGGGISEEWR